MFFLKMRRLCNVQAAISVNYIPRGLLYKSESLFEKCSRKVGACLLALKPDNTTTIKGE